MALDDDAILLSFFERYNEEDEEEQLKFEVIKYVSGNFGSKPVVQDEQNTTGDTLDSMSSPVDSAVDMKKKKRLAALNQKKKAEEKLQLKALKKQQEDRTKLESEEKKQIEDDEVVLGRAHVGTFDGCGGNPGISVLKFLCF